MQTSSKFFCQLTKVQMERVDHQFQPSCKQSYLQGKILVPDYNTLANGKCEKKCKIVLKKFQIVFWRKGSVPAENSTPPFVTFFSNI